MDQLIDDLLQVYEDRRTEAEMFVAQVRTFFSKSPEFYPEGQLPIIHSIKSRIKNPEHLRDKLQRKLADGLSVDPGNFFDQITDLAGVRVLHLYGDQFPIIHNAIMRQVAKGNWVLNEDPVANTWDPEAKKFYELMGIKTAIRESLYTSIHYVIKPNNNPNMVCCEIQVRTLFEEIWGEIDHTINYPHKTESIACSEQLKVLAKLSSTGTRLADSIFRTYNDYKLNKANGSRE